MVLLFKSVTTFIKSGITKLFNAPSLQPPQFVTIQPSVNYVFDLCLMKRVQIDFKLNWSYHGFTWLIVSEQPSKPCKFNIDGQALNLSPMYDFSSLITRSKAIGNAIMIWLVPNSKKFTTSARISTTVLIQKNSNLIRWVPIMMGIFEIQAREIQAVRFRPWGEPSSSLEIWSWFGEDSWLTAVSFNIDA